MFKIDILKVIIFGDWNIIFNWIDKFGGFLWKVISGRNIFVDFMEELNFIDIYCELYLKFKFFIYVLKLLNLKLRIDYFFILCLFFCDVR